MADYWDRFVVGRDSRKVYHSFIGPNADRYMFDFERCNSKDGWKQYDTDQDASYFGVWVHLKRHLVVTFAEGDLTLVVCYDDEAMKTELKSMGEFYGDPPPAFKVIDVEANTITHINDERPEVD